MRRRMRSVVMAVAFAAAAGVIVSGCAEKKAVPAPSQRQVQSNSDRLFETMKEEERDHGKVSSNGGGY